jgi:hypothetical protein
VARALLEPTVALFERWDTRAAGLFTFPQSAKHVSLYQRYGFWPQQLTVVMAKAIEPGAGDEPAARHAELASSARTSCLAECRALTDAVFAGLDVSVEIRAAADQSLGDTVLVRDAGALAAFAVCHVGAGSEAGSGAAYVKFGAARPGHSAPHHFERLLAACEAFARERGAVRLMAGVNTARHDAYRAMIARGYRNDAAGRRDAAAQPARIQPARLLRARRLALTRPSCAADGADGRSRRVRPP